MESKAIASRLAVISQDIAKLYYDVLGEVMDEAKGKSGLELKFTVKGDAVKERVK